MGNSSKSVEFFHTSYSGNLPRVQELSLDPAVNLNLQDDNGYTALSSACFQGNIEIVRFLLTLPSLLPNLPDCEGSTPFYIACCFGHVEMVSLFLADPRIDVVKPANEQTTPLFIACQNGHVEVVSLLLADPRIDVTQAREGGLTSFFVACQNGHVEVLLLLLADQRVDVNKPRLHEVSPLWIASQQGHLVVVKHLLASGREIHVAKESTFNGKTAEEQARFTASRPQREENEAEEVFQRKRENCPKIADLIEEFEDDQNRTRWRLVKELGLGESKAGELFSMVVYLSDGYLKILDGNEMGGGGETNVQRFFLLAGKLPLDLQMVLCNCTFGLRSPIIKRNYSERGFRKFAKGF